jgi:ribosomal protein S18 acetylase RimI-like enzyme
MIEKITLRPATANDFELAKRIHHTTLREVVDRVWGWDEAQQDDLFRTTFRPETMQIIQVGAKDAGVLAVETPRPGEVFLANIQILPEYQNRGVGTQLLKGLIDEARRTKTRLTLKVLRPNPARRLYERLGFSVVAEDDKWFYMRLGE